MMEAPHQPLIAALAADMRPVRRMLPPAVRAACWVAVVAAVACLSAPVADLDAVRLRLAALPDLRWAAWGAGATALCAAVSACTLCVPGRSSLWSLLPGPALAVWLGASGWGCLRGWGLPGLAPATVHDAAGCAAFILLASVPLSALMLVILRRARPLRPGRVAAMGGLAAAAAAAGLLTFFHPHDASALDQGVHLTAVGAVVWLSAALGRRSMRPEGKLVQPCRLGQHHVHLTRETLQ